VRILAARRSKVILLYRNLKRFAPIFFFKKERIHHRDAEKEEKAKILGEEVGPLRLCGEFSFLWLSFKLYVVLHHVYHGVRI
jgi:hypothetical protein